MKIKYKEHNFRKKTLALIETINSVISEYQRQGYTLTLRQTYYQLVARGFIENSENSYERIGDTIDKARLAGLIDWEAITDRTRYLRSLSHWTTPAGIIDSASYSYRLDKWAYQPNYIEVWIEKDALVDVIGKACTPLDVPYFSCRGYCSQSAMWRAAQRFIDKVNHDGRYILHLGDHDSSGVDMTRDIADRLQLFGASVEVRRLALTPEQIQIFNPPPAPAKESDSRTKQYKKQHGDNVWELDALEPQFIERLVTNEIRSLMDDNIFAKTCELENAQQSELQIISDNYSEICTYLKHFTSDANCF